MDQDYYLGQIELFPYTYVLKDWMACQGQLLQILEYKALYALLGDRFGGDNVTTFALPNLQDKAPLPGLTYCMLVEGGMFPPPPYSEK